MYEKITKCPNFTWYLQKNIFQIFFFLGGARGPPSPSLWLWLNQVKFYGGWSPSTYSVHEPLLARQQATILSFVEMTSVWLPNLALKWNLESLTELLRLKFFTTAVLTLNFDLDLSEVNNDIWRRDRRRRRRRNDDDNNDNNNNNKLWY